MAEVFKAKATGVEGFERLVAVKRILPSIAEDEEFITMFVDEAKIAVQLTHANVAQIFDLGRVDGSYFIALEYVHGKDLRTMFNRARQRGEVLPIPLACYAIMRLCEGLDYAHNKHDSSGRFLNLVHRDVSPQNILVSYEGEVKIIDFGIAKAAGKAGRTQAGILKGKFGYMSPEQVQGLEIDRRSDVFGVGICLYELLTGERLFVAESDFATLERVRAVDIMPPSTYNRRVPEELEQIVMRALARDRDQRHQSALQLHDDLQAFMHTSGNLFSRKDLSGYMHRVFADEIEKESARDREFEALDRVSSLAHLEDDIDTLDVQPVNALSAFNSARDEDEEEDSALAGSMGGIGGMAGREQPESRRRTSTLLGVPRASGPRVPQVPRPIPGPASIPPPSHNRQLMPQPVLTGHTLLGASHGQGMDWDEDELSTQIYDKPEQRYREAQGFDDDEHDGHDGHDDEDHGGPNGYGRHDDEDHVHDEDLAALEVLKPEERSEELDRAPRVIQRAVAPLAAPRSPRTDPPIALPDPELPVSAGRTRKSRRPAMVAVIAVFAIVGCIVAALAIFRRREPGTVNLTTVPSRVAVSVDGRALGESTSPLVIGELSPGRRHEIVVSSPGFQSWSQGVELEPSQVLTLDAVTLKRTDTGFALETIPSGATVFIDGKPFAEHTPVRVTDLEPGEHKVRAELAGLAGWETSVEVKAGTVLPLPDVALQAAPAAAAAPPPEDAALALSTRGAGRKSGSSARGSRAARANRSADDSVQAADDADPGSEGAAPTAKSEPAREPEAPAPKPAAPAPAADPLLDDDPPKPEPSTPEPTAKSAAAESGTLRVNSRPWSEVFIDGKPYGNTPRFNIELPAGPHTLELVNKEFNVTKKREFTITAGKVETLVVNLQD